MFLRVTAVFAFFLNEFQTAAIAKNIPRARHALVRVAPTLVEVLKYSLTTCHVAGRFDSRLGETAAAFHRDNNNDDDDGDTSDGDVGETLIESTYYTTTQQDGSSNHATLIALSIDMICVNFKSKFVVKVPASFL